MTDRPALPLRPLGQTGMQVSSICFGAGPLGDLNMRQFHTYAVPEERALETVRAVFDGPITFLDTAAFYGEGESERRIGLVIRERGGLPPGFVLGTKVDRDLRSNDFGGDQVRRSLERSLKLLGLNRLDLVHLHDPEFASQDYAQLVAPGGAVDALVRLREEGVVQAIGIAAGPVDLSTRFLETGAFDVVLTHNRYTLLSHSAEPLIALAHARGLGVLNAAPYGSGILAQGPDAFPHYVYRRAHPAVVQRVREIESICREYDVPLAAAALQLSLRNPRVTSTIVGMTRPERIAETVALAAHPIPDPLWQRLEPLVIPGDPFADDWHT